MGRRFGQHFLARQSILDRIADASAGGTTVIEIGPGKGALTQPLLDRFQRVIAIEVDPVLVHYLRQKFRDVIAEGRLTVVEGDVMKIDLPALCGDEPVIAGNLPYYITSPILELVFALPHWVRAVFLVQAEVGQRITAQPGSRDYGYLSVIAQVHAKAEYLFEVPPEAFRPPPKVNSAVVRLEPLTVTGMAPFLRFASACFRYKRKTLRNNLSNLYGKEILDALPEGRKRAEQMGIPDLIALHKKLHELTGT